MDDESEVGSPTEQEALHDALVGAMGLGDGEFLTGWLVVYESVKVGGLPTAGHFYGPAGMTSWRALGLAEWAARFTLAPDAVEDDDGGE